MCAAKKTISKKTNKTPKTRNAGTMTESAFWSFIRSALRQKSRWWKPIAQAKQAAKRKYKGPNKRQKFEYLCNVCKQYFPDKEINVDHIVPAGTLRCANDLPGFVERLFCEVNNLQVLCSTCHNKKTQDEKTTTIK
jgi:5-methylcytosine-specific restriction endonuclease McrA